MLDSFQLAELLIARGFHRLSKDTRTKAHGFEHPDLVHPVYLKVNGGGKDGPVQPATEAPFVVHVDEHLKIAKAGVPAGAKLKATDYKNTGLSKFQRSGAKGPVGCDYWVSGATALDALLQLMGAGPAEAPLADLAVKDYALRAAMAEVDADPTCVAEPPSVREALIKARIGQGRYRDGLLELWEGRCAVTGCAIQEGLIASHIHAWRYCQTTQERLDPYNGLLLTASIDRLFDLGLISFADDGALLTKTCLPEVDLAHLGLTPKARLRCVYPQNKPYLAAHRARYQFP